jgi:diacylglycerol O-acyltransferase / wax synthase
MAIRERISGVDTAWLRMEHPTNLMMIVGVLMFKERLNATQVQKVIEGRWLKFARFRQRAVQDPAGAWWVEDTKFSMKHHFTRHKLPGKAGKEELEELCSELSSKPLDFNRPLWHFHLVDNYEGGSALITRIHHCYADGIALIGVMLSLTGKTPEESLLIPKQKPGSPSRKDMDFWTSVTKPMAGAWKNAMKLTRALLEQGLEIAKDPTMARDIALKGIDLADELRKIALMTSDSPTRFKGELGVKKRAAWADPLPLAEVKIIGKVLGCSINDVLLSTAAGALRAYLAEKGDATSAIEFRGVVPVNLRPVERAGDLGNQFGLVFVELPVGVEDPVERLRIVQARMNALKASSQPIVAFVLLNAVGLGPKILQDQIGALIGRNASAVMTNVPGPQHPLYFAGKEITELDFWVPQSGGIGMGVSILSYNGKVQFGVITDAKLVPDPEAIIRHFNDEFETLVLQTLMGPYGPEFEEGLEAAFGEPKEKPEVESPPSTAPKRKLKRLRK